MSAPRRQRPHHRAGSVVLAAAAVLAVLVGTSGVVAADERLPATKLFALQDDRIDEASGMVASTVHDGVLWMVNDSGGGAYVYGVDSAGRTVARLTLLNAVNQDWEAMAPGVNDNGNPALWIADIGDNAASRPFVRLFRIDEPRELGEQEAAWRKYDLTYPDGAHNAEALLVAPTTQRVYVVTKEALGAGVYRAPAKLTPGETHEMERVADAPMFVTDGAFAPDGRQVALRTYTSLLLQPDVSGEGAERFALPRQPQGETLAYAPDGRSLYVGSEGVGAAVHRIDLSGAAGGSTDPEPTPGPGEGGAVPTPPPSGAAGGTASPSALPWVLAAAGTGAIALLALAGVLATLRKRQESRSMM